MDADSIGMMSSSDVQSNTSKGTAANKGITTVSALPARRLVSVMTYTKSRPDGSRVDRMPRSKAIASSNRSVTIAPRSLSSHDDGRPRGGRWEEEDWLLLVGTLTPSMRLVVARSSHSAPGDETFLNNEKPRPL